jgi:hypothetical protein
MRQAPEASDAATKISKGKAAMPGTQGSQKFNITIADPS